ncbi:MAG: hypothetical protein V3T65_01315 [Acidobacteriota bacterium]
MSRSLFCRLLVLGGVLLFLPPVGVLAQEPAEEQPNELVAGRLIYVNRMPGELDRWIVDFLRRWGKYTVTGDPEGVDLVWDAHRAGTEVRYRLDRRRGLPTPERRDDGGKNAISLTITDWVTGEPLWHVALSSKKRKKKDPLPPAGPRTKVITRKLSAEQLADRIVERLREYVKQLEDGQESSPTTTPAAESG